MTEPHAKDDLLRYLRDAREALLWKLDGLSEYDVRRPLTPTGTNLLGLVKHASGVELAYFGDTFGRPFFAPGEEPSWWYTRDTEDNADMWATEDEPRDEVVGLYRRAWQHADTTFETLPLDAVGRVPWWPDERGETTLHHIAVRVVADTHRHAGHADILRELIDGQAGMLPHNDSLPPADRAGWRAHRDRVERSARTAGGR
ncbi:DinB family protein [Streptomyces sp. PmtG]